CRQHVRAPNHHEQSPPPVSFVVRLAAVFAAPTAWPQCSQRPHPVQSGNRLYPTMSLAEKNCAISLAAVSGASEPCTELSPVDLAWTLRMVLGAALAGSVAPITSRYFAMAFSPCKTCTTTGPEIMKLTSSPKNGRSLCTA